MHAKSLSHVQLFTTPWTVAHQAPLPMGFSRQEYWSGLPGLSPDVGSNLHLIMPPALQVCSLPLVLLCTMFLTGALGEILRNLSKSVCSAVLSYFSHVQLSATPWTVACQASLSMRFSRQKYWSGLPFPTPGKSCVSVHNTFILLRMSSGEFIERWFEVVHLETFVNPKSRSFLLEIHATISNNDVPKAMNMLYALCLPLCPVILAVNSIYVTLKMDSPSRD